MTNKIVPCINGNFGVQLEGAELKQKSHPVQDRITDVLTHILSDRYTPTEQDDRYTFVGGSTTGGLVVYDDKYAFSHHATDPAGGKLCNAFDLVRWHLFTPGGTAPDGSSVGDEKNSIKRMQEYAAQDEATKRQLAEERSAQAMEAKRRARGGGGG